MRPMNDAACDSAPSGAEWPAEEPPIAWRIRDVHGQLRAALLRYPGKTFAWRGPDGRSSLGGVGVEHLPLYLTETLPRIPYDTLIVIVEGPKAADALRRQAIPVLATVTGAAGTPSREVLEVLRGRPVILWADNDPVGREHMQRIGELLLNVAAEIWWIDTKGLLPLSGDAADVPSGQLVDFLDMAMPFVATRARA